MLFENKCTASVKDTNVPNIPDDMIKRKIKHGNEIIDIHSRNVYIITESRNHKTEDHDHNILCIITNIPSFLI